MNLLLHICCAPCTIYPLECLRRQGMEVGGYFYNPNIHPWKEWQRRQETLQGYADRVGLQVVVDDRYDLELFLDRTRPWEKGRCRSCYALRLEATARKAKELGMDAFSTTLLYSRYQRHDWIKAAGEEMGKRWGVPFHYQDFRPGWQEGIRRSKELGLYRQPYCGCIFSEKERYLSDRPSQGKERDSR